MSRADLMVRTTFAFVLALLFLGCSGGTAADSPQLNAQTGQHPANWLSTHWSEYAKSPTQCTTCHGSLTDPLKAGGISKVSCFTCHPKGPGHPAGWEAFDQHGRLGAMTAPSASTGFAYCFKCHGAQPRTGLTATSCLTCHTIAPHPSKPWRSTTVPGSNHDATDPGNAAACYNCHANGANSTLAPITPAAAGTEPGCFNNTMCHGKTF